MNGASRNPPRYCARPLPPYRYLPGHTPHPVRDPGGHAFGQDLPRTAELEPDRWWQSTAYLYGVDLFNHRYWWEAHETWESCWRHAGRRSRLGKILQGLIQAAAACLKTELGNPAGAQQLGRAALARLPAGSGQMLGQDMDRLRGDLQRYLSGECSTPPRMQLAMPANTKGRAAR